MNSRLTANEQSPIPLLLGQTFIFGLTSTILCTAANTLFITAYGAEALPTVYIALALFIPCVSFLYERSYRFLSRTTLAWAAAITFSTLCFFGWYTESRSSYHWPAYLLLIGWNAYTLVSNLLQGDQIQRLFNVRQIKKAVPTIMAGSIVGSILGGLMVGPIVAFFGSPNELLLVCGCLIPLSLMLELLTIHRYPVIHQKKERKATSSPKKPLSLAKLLRTRYVRLILIYGICYGLALRLIGYLFMTSADEYAKSPDQLSHLLGLSYSVGTAGSLAFVLFGSTRLIQRFGLGAALAGSPLLIGPFAVAATAVIFLGGPSLPIYFWLIVIVFLLTNVLDSGTTTTALRTTLQALPVSDRSLGETAAKGLGRPLGNGIAGASLLLLQISESGGGKWTLIFLLAVGFLWVLSSRLLYHDYGQLLAKTLRRRALGTTELKIEDGKTLSVLEEYLDGEDPHNIRLALDVLRESNHPTYENRVLQLTERASLQSRIIALQQIETEQIKGGLSYANSVLETSEEAQLLAAAVPAYCSIVEAECVDRVSNLLNHKSQQVRASALSGLLRYGGISGILAAGESVFAMLRDSDPRQRQLLAQVIGQVGDRNLYQILLPLLEDDCQEVRQDALLAARTVKHARLAQSVTAALSDRALRSSAMAALTALGDLALPTLSNELNKGDQFNPTSIRMLRAVPRTPDQCEAGITLLKNHIQHPSPPVRAQLLQTLSAMRYTPTDSEQSTVRSALYSEIEHGLRVLKVQKSIAGKQQFTPLDRELTHEFRIRCNCVIHLLSFIADSETILGAGKTLVHGSSTEQAVALETLELSLSRELRHAISPLFNQSEELAHRIHHLEASLPTDQRSSDTTVFSIISNRSQHWNYTWTRIWAIYLCTKLQMSEAMGSIETCLTDPKPELRQIARWAISKMNEDAGIDRRNDSTEKGDSNPMLLTIEKLNVLNRVELFAETPDFALAAIAELAEELAIPKGESFMKRGDPGDEMFVIVDGKAQLHVGELELAELSPGESVGERAMFDTKPRVASATALEELHILKITKEAFQEAMADRPEIAQNTLRVLATRLRMAEKRISTIDEAE